MKKQILKLTYNDGIYTVVNDDSRKENPYGIFSYKGTRKICEERYDDLTSCLLRLLELVNGGKAF